MRIVLLGGGGHASDVLGVVEMLQRTGVSIDVAGVCDDNWTRPDRFEGRDVPLIDGIDSAVQLDADFVAAIGYPDPRRRIVERARIAGLRAASALMSPQARLPVHFRAGAGAVVLPGAALSPRVTLGEHSAVGVGAALGHDTAVGDYASVMPGAAVSGDV
ncbi:MAG: hypothetical protein GY698_00655, partial [Actinomycetia bacterium]|nr:hypothetical protein [Actinomycetes bacterium]